MSLSLAFLPYLQRPYYNWKMFTNEFANKKTGVRAKSNPEDLPYPLELQEGEKKSTKEKIGGINDPPPTHTHTTLVTSQSYYGYCSLGHPSLFDPGGFELPLLREGIPKGKVKF